MGRVEQDGVDVVLGAAVEGGLAGELAGTEEVGEVGPAGFRGDAGDVGAVGGAAQEEERVGLLDAGVGEDGRGERGMVLRGVSAMVTGVTPGLTTIVRPSTV